MSSRFLGAFAAGWSLSGSRDYLNWVRYICVGAVACLTTLSALLLVSAASIVAEHQHVIDSRTAREPAQIDRVRDLPLTGEFRADWAGLKFTRVVIAAPEDAVSPPTSHEASELPFPPGIDHLPLPGEIYLSPALADEADTSPALSHFIDQFTSVEVIAPDGLTSPHELRLIQGASRSTVRGGVMAVTEGYGSTQPPILRSVSALAFVVPLALVLAFGPLLLSLVIASRLTLAETRRRMFVLRCLGASLSQRLAVATVELVPAAICGTLLGWLAFDQVWLRMSRVPGTAFVFWPEQASIAGLATTIICLAVPLIALLAAGSLILLERDRGVRSTQAGRRTRWWWCTALAVAIACLFVAALVPSHSTWGRRLLIVSAALAMVGASPAVHVLTDRLASLGAHHARYPSELLGARWAGNRTSASFRVGTALASAILAACVALPFVNSLSGDEDQPRAALAVSNGYNLMLTNTPIAADEVEALTGVRASFPIWDAEGAGHRPVQLVAASCAELATIVSTSNCFGRTQWLKGSEGAAGSSHVGVRPPVRIGDNAVLRKLPTTETRARLGASFDGSIRVEPSSSINTRTPSAYLINLADGGTSLALFEADVATVAPAASLRNDFASLLLQAQSFSPFARFLLLCSLVGLAGLFIAFAATSARSAFDHRRSARRVESMGATPRTRTTALLIAQCAPVLVASTLTISFTAVYWVCCSSVDERMAVGPTAWWACATIPLLSATVAALTVLPAQLSLDGWRTPAEVDTPHPALDDDIVTQVDHRV